MRNDSELQHRRKFFSEIRKKNFGNFDLVYYLQLFFLFRFCMLQQQSQTGSSPNFGGMSSPTSLLPSLCHCLPSPKEEPGQFGHLQNRVPTSSPSFLHLQLQQPHPLFHGSILSKGGNSSLIVPNKNSSTTPTTVNTTGDQGQSRHHSNSSPSASPSSSCDSFHPSVEGSSSKSPSRTMST